MFCWGVAYLQRNQKYENYAKLPYNTKCYFYKVDLSVRCATLSHP